MSDSVLARVAAVEAILIRVENNSDKRHEENQKRAEGMEKRVGKMEAVLQRLKGAFWAFGTIGTLLGTILAALEVHRAVTGK